MTGPRRIYPQTAAFEARLRRYLQLRQDGVNPVEAARQVGIAPGETRRRYERWHRAGMTPGHPGGEGGT